MKAAQNAFIANHVEFRKALAICVWEFTPDGSIPKRGQLEVSSCPVATLFTCYSLRLLRNRFPFLAVPVEEIVIPGLSKILVEMRGDRPQMPLITR